MWRTGSHKQYRRAASKEPTQPDPFYRVGVLISPFLHPQIACCISRFMLYMLFMSIDNNFFFFLWFDPIWVLFGEQVIRMRRCLSCVSRFGNLKKIFLLSVGEFLSPRQHKFAELILHFYFSNEFKVCGKVFTCETRLQLHKLFTKCTNSRGR